MSKKAIIALVIVLGVVLVVFLKMNKDKDGMKQGGVVTYKCMENKSFSLTYVDKDTVTISGTGIATMNLDETAVGYWISKDGKVVAKTAGNAVVVVQNDKTTHEQCAVTK